MTKLTNTLNQIWYEQDGERTRIGFTQSFLNTLDECWHILPADRNSVKEKAPLMTVETNDCLVSILSPISGNFMDWNPNASNFPDRLTENDVIITLTSAKREKVSASARSVYDDMLDAAIATPAPMAPRRALFDEVPMPTWTGTTVATGFVGGGGATATIDPLSRAARREAERIASQTRVEGIVQRIRSEQAARPNPVADWMIRNHIAPPTRADLPQDDEI